MAFAPDSGRCWIRRLLAPEIKVSFINTDPLLPVSREEAKGNRIVNPTEANICIQLVESLLSVGVPASSIGVMTHYRSQLSLLKHGLRNRPDVEMHTADRFQGRDKEVIILSLVRSNETKSIGELLKDWRRINVAFTRAKTKLLVIGSRETLKGNGPKDGGEEEMVARFVKLMESKDWIFDLPVNALEDHLFEERGTQVTASAKSGPAGTQLRAIKTESPRKNEELEPAFFGVSNGVKRKALEEYTKENTKLSVPGGGFGVAGKRVPAKRMQGQKPFKIPSMGVLRDVVNEALG
jgi:DNA replication ATP-dependent helicase Dna2